LPAATACVWWVSVWGSKQWSWWCIEFNRKYFIDTISNPCQD
jgi:hypothetical protein